MDFELEIDPALRARLVEAAGDAMWQDATETEVREHLLWSMTDDRPRSRGEHRRGRTDAA